MKKLSLVVALLASLAAADDRVHFTFDSSEADAVLAILDARVTGKTVSDANWQRLFATEPYQRLKQREASMHRDFSDEDFKRFVLSADLAVIGGGFAKPEVADHVAFTFFGYRGPWYTVGYKMGQMVEKRFGRAVLIDCIRPAAAISEVQPGCGRGECRGKGTEVAAVER